MIRSCQSDSLGSAVFSSPAVAYLRASTKKQHLSCDDQLHAIEEYCQRKGFNLVKVFTDDGVSGTKARTARAGWDELLCYVEAGHLTGGVVVVWSLDRWARDLRAGLLASWTVGDFDVQLHTTDSGNVDLSSVEGQLMGTLKLALAALESRERSRRVRERKALHRAAGYWVTQNPLGFVTHGSKGRKELIPDPTWSPIILELFEGFDRDATYDQLAS
ncbi:MAG: recombinase family protein [Candidatus Krumholzibacteriia bacterium]